MEVNADRKGVIHVGKCCKALDLETGREGFITCSLPPNTQCDVIYKLWRAAQQLFLSVRLVFALISGNQK